MSQHEERNAWGQASQIKLVPGINYPNQGRECGYLDAICCNQGVNLNTGVQKPSLAEVLEFKSSRMDCADESTPHEETRIYSSILEGGNVMQKFEGSNSGEPHSADEHPDRLYPVRSEGRYVTPTNPWPRDPEKETRDNVSVQKESRILIEDKGIDGTNMVSHLPQHPQRHTS